MTRRVVLISTLLLVLASVVGSSAAQPSEDELGRRFLAHLLTPAFEAAEELGWTGGWAIRLPRAGSAGAQLGGPIAEFLHRRGLTTFVLTGREEPDEEVLLLEVTVEELSLEYGDPKRAFLGLGAARVDRKAVMVVDLSLTDYQSGRLLYEGRRERRYADSIPAELQPSRAADGFFAGASAGNEASNLRPKGPSWIERGVAAGLLGGVVILYFSGAS